MSSILPKEIKLADTKLLLGIEDRVCIFNQDSGAGKTFLFTNIARWARQNGKIVLQYNNSNIPRSEESIKRDGKGSDIIIFDNADLYCSYNMIKDTLDSTDALILVSVKRGFLTGKMPLYICKYTPGIIEVKKVT